MNEYIEKRKALSVLHLNYKDVIYIDKRETAKLVEAIKGIDIVRCQDCKYWVYNFNGCARNPCTEPWYATDGCTYGERKEVE